MRMSDEPELIAESELIEMLVIIRRVLGLEAAAHCRRKCGAIELVLRLQPEKPAASEVQSCAQGSVPAPVPPSEVKDGVGVGRCLLRLLP